MGRNSAGASRRCRLPVWATVTVQLRSVLGRTALWRCASWWLGTRLSAVCCCPGRPSHGDHGPSRSRSVVTVAAPATARPGQVKLPLGGKRRPCELTREALRGPRRDLASGPLAACTVTTPALGPPRRPRPPPGTVPAAGSFSLVSGVHDHDVAPGPLAGDRMVLLIVRT